jgi:hypothetical protein
MDYLITIKLTVDHFFYNKYNKKRYFKIFFIAVTSFYLFSINFDKNNFFFFKKKT